ncbi:MAG: hypothetical protein WCW03_01005 [Candidatus Paceibacterota bacterium]|jgi:hypothetical protein
MIIPCPNSNSIFTRIIRGRNGALLRVSFEVYEIDGQFKGRVVGVEKVMELNGNVKCHTLCLPAHCLKDKIATNYIPAYAPTISPYIELYFFNSQPTRAPSSK